MAVFGMYCVIFLTCDELRCECRTAIKIKNSNDLKTLESMILQADTSFFSSRREKYALIVDYDLDEELFGLIAEKYSDRVEIYRHITKKDEK